MLGFIFWRTSPYQNLSNKSAGAWILNINPAGQHAVDSWSGLRAKQVLSENLRGHQIRFAINYRPNDPQEKCGDSKNLNILISFITVSVDYIGDCFI